MESKKDNSNRITHLGMIQNVIARFSKNCFTIKSWNITFLTAFLVFGLQTDISMPRILTIAIAFSLGFMALEWYYLNLEKSYRNLYKAVSKIENDDDVDFRMEFHKKIDLPSKYEVENTELLYGLKRPIIYAFYTAEILFLVMFLIIF